MAIRSAPRKGNSPDFEVKFATLRLYRQSTKDDEVVGGLARALNDHMVMHDGYKYLESGRPSQVPASSEILETVEEPGQQGDPRLHRISLPYDRSANTWPLSR